MFGVIPGAGLGRRYKFLCRQGLASGLRLLYLIFTNTLAAIIIGLGVVNLLRPGEGGGHRSTAIGRVAADLALSPAKQSTLTRLHDIRNRVTYRAPLPPITKADADAMQAILNDMLAAARILFSR